MEESPACKELTELLSQPTLFDLMAAFIIRCTDEMMHAQIDIVSMMTFFHKKWQEHPQSDVPPSVRVLIEDIHFGGSGLQWSDVLERVWMALLISGLVYWIGNTRYLWVNPEIADHCMKRSGLDQHAQVYICTLATEYVATSNR